ncbi:WbqC family protein [Accumulibacter sp.]|uniref:WbqC family protein n=1 Tax=Accumulibacter sp. TaxID=2053492 RepID=UPI0025F77C2B|nr:WbqC family protein [Accumulibacter sp.]MCM8612112.1 WbqC family protein [Accumulibacter sp.]MCM8635778.1 WbqC family protein [Accumulibacter sp.]MCM8639585.1 WbqC family protein [Accumulibacter sp.]
MSRTIAIHQPNFFPWLGYFDKMARSDVFVFLDHVQFPKKGGVWCNRVQMLVAGEARWVTAPIRRAFHGVAPINEIEWADEQPWRSRLLKTLAANYSRAPFYSETMDWLAPLILSPENNLARYNMAVIRAIADQVGLRHDHCVPSSALGCDGQASDLLISLTRRLDGSCYLCGGGASGYQDDQAFARAGISLAYQRYQHPVYRQKGAEDFVPGLSIVDSLANVGKAGVGTLLAVR